MTEIDEITKVAKITETKKIAKKVMVAKQQRLPKLLIVNFGLTNLDLVYEQKRIQNKKYRTKELKLSSDPSKFTI